MSDQGLSIFDEPDETPEVDEEPTRVLAAQDDTGDEQKRPARPVKKAGEDRACHDAGRRPAGCGARRS